MKGDKIEIPDLYIGEELLNMTNIDCQGCWNMSYDTYFLAAVTNVQYLL